VTKKSITARYERRESSNDIHHLACMWLAAGRSLLQFYSRTPTTIGSPRWVRAAVMATRPRHSNASPAHAREILQATPNILDRDGNGRLHNPYALLLIASLWWIDRLVTRLTATHSRLQQLHIPQANEDNSVTT
jgi:hypothetical protein